MILQYSQKSELPTIENITRMKDLIASTLENFEIVEINTKKESEKGIPLDEIPHTQIPSRDHKGEFCYKCGLQKEYTQIINKGEKIIRMCKECLGE